MNDMLADLDDDALVTAIVQAPSVARRDAAFHELVERYHRRVYGMTLRYFGSHGDAEDATQEVFLTLARKLDQFRHDSKLSTWIYRVTTNVCHDLARHRARRPQTPVADVGEVVAAELGSEPATEDVLAGHELAAEIQAALLQLDETSRTLMILCSIEGRDYAEVSAMLDLPVGTIKSRVFRARARLAEILAPVLDPDESDDGEPPRHTQSPPLRTPPRATPVRGPPGNHDDRPDV